MPRNQGPRSHERKNKSRGTNECYAFLNACWERGKGGDLVDTPIDQAIGIVQPCLSSYSPVWMA